MAIIPTAGFDPIFWMHHGNVDRLWAEWTNSPNGKKVTVEELQKVNWPYQFFEPDGTIEEYTKEEVVDTLYNLNYVYVEPDGQVLSLTPDTIGLAVERSPGVLRASQGT